MPTLVNVPIVTINTPQGVQNVPNPLYNYKFHPLPGATSFPQGDGVCFPHLKCLLDYTGIFLA